ncbi:hypothetical protein QUW13_04930 [Enterococcus hirae]|nr:hypothetical protein [Enterococcus hirae]
MFPWISITASTLAEMKADLARFPADWHTYQLQKYAVSIFENEKEAIRIFLKHDEASQLFSRFTYHARSGKYRASRKTYQKLQHFQQLARLLHEFLRTHPLSG